MLVWSEKLSVDGGALLQKWSAGGSVCQRGGVTALTLHTIIKGVTGHQGTPVEICREDKRLCFQPLHDCQSLWLPCHIVVLKGIWEVSVQVVIVDVLPLKKDFVVFIGGCG